MRTIESKILMRTAMQAECERLRKAGKKIVFTNGSFDLLHDGHVSYLQFAREQGDLLIVGLNSDASVRRYKGPQRPILEQEHRARLLAALEMVDYVCIFDEDEPRDLIAALQPDVLVKAEDWAHYVSGRDVVEAHGGKVVLAKMVAGLSTTELIRRILAAYGNGKPEK
jgi:D-beta-D-heptose 7-phosphate kinase/D-beta-D-heptose 1-phosphate adenosyltransferase